MFLTEAVVDIKDEKSNLSDMCEPLKHHVTSEGKDGWSRRPKDANPCEPP